MPSNDPSAPPSKELLLLEVRAIAELSAFFYALPLLRRAPTGDGHPVLVLPGLAAGDVSTRPLRTFLSDRGYEVHGWEQGSNFGPRPGVQDRMQKQLAALHERHGRKVSIIGWSLGGIFARELARSQPDYVRSVISLGSPFAGNRRANNVWRLYERVSGRSIENSPYPRLKAPPPVPTTAIFSRTDGIVAWQGCMEEPGPITENIEVEGSHCGLGHNPLVLYAIADRLAQPEGEWRPFERTGLRQMVYPDPYRDVQRVARSTARH